LRLARQIARAIRARGGWVSLDVGMKASQQVPRKILQIIPLVDIPHVTADEAALLTGELDAYKAFARLQKSGAREVVLKLGKHGCLISDRCTIPSTGFGTGNRSASDVSRGRSISHFHSGV
jgi:2-dehydro-3-deoxygluconokinase